MLRIESRVFVTLAVLPAVAVCQAPAKAPAPGAKPPTAIPIQLPQLPAVQIPRQVVIPNGLGNLPQVQPVPMIRVPIARQLPLQEGFIIVDGFNPAGSSPATLKKFLEEEVKSMTSRLKLNKEQVRRLQVAAKGVQHRARRKAAAKTEDLGVLLGAPAGGNNRVLIRNVGWRFQPAVNRNKQFRDQLGKSKLWKKTVEGVLTREQLEQWKQPKPTAKAQSVGIWTIPIAPNLPGRLPPK